MTSPRVLLLFLCAVGAMFAAPVRFEIPAQPAPDALQLFIRQSGAKVLFLYDDVKDVRTNAVMGEFESAAALTSLLEGTSLRGERNGDGRFTVARVTTARNGSIEGSVRDESGKPVAGAKVALDDSEVFVLTDRRGRFVLEQVPAGPHELGILAEGMQKTKVTDITVRGGFRHSLSAIVIPTRNSGVEQMEPYLVSAKKMTE